MAIPNSWGRSYGPGLAGFTRSIEGLGFHPGLAWAWAVTLVEFVGGICVFVGFATRIAAALIAIEMIIGGLLVNVPRGFYWSQGGSRCRSSLP